MRLKAPSLPAAEKYYYTVMGRGVVEGGSVRIMRDSLGDEPPFKNATTLYLLPPSFNTLMYTGFISKLLIYIKKGVVKGVVNIAPMSQLPVLQFSDDTIGHVQ